MVPLRDSLPTVPEAAGRKAAAVRLQDLLRRGRQNKKTLHLQSPYIYRNNFIFLFYPTLLNVQSKPS